jgi:hypothetical protein
MLEPRVLMAGSPYAGFSNGPPTDPGFFPIGVWYQNLTTTVINGYGAMGVNVYVYPASGMTTGLLTTIKNAGMYAVLPQDAFGLSQVANKTIIGWFNSPDEPDNAQPNGSGGYGDPVNPQAMIAKYNALRAGDATRPVLVNLGQAVAWDGWIGRGARTGHSEDYGYNSTYTWTNGVTYTGGYAAASDIAAFDFYPMNATRAGAAGRMDLLANGVDRLVEWSKPGNAVWNYIETTDITVGDAAPGPTPSEVKAEVWLSLVHGSRGIVYFAHQFPGSTHRLLDDPVMNPAVTAINAQVKALAPVLNSDTTGAGTVVTGNGGTVRLDFMTKDFGGDGYVFAVSDQTSSGRALFRDPSMGGVDGTVEVIGEGRTVPLVDGVFRDTFGSAGVHLYRVIGADGFSPQLTALVQAGDVNGDGTVSFTDFVTLANHFGASTGLGVGVGDLNEDGTVNFADFVILANNFGATAGVTVGASAMVASEDAAVERGNAERKAARVAERAEKKAEVVGLDVMQVSVLDGTVGGKRR